MAGLLEEMQAMELYHEADRLQALGSTKTILGIPVKKSPEATLRDTQLRLEITVQLMAVASDYTDEQDVYMNQRLCNTLGSYMDCKRKLNTLRTDDRWDSYSKEEKLRKAAEVFDDSFKVMKVTRAVSEDAAAQMVERRTNGYTYQRQTLYTHEELLESEIGKSGYQEVSR